MLDIKFIRENPEAFDAGMKARGLNYTANEIIAKSDNRKELLTQQQLLQANNNDLAKQIGVHMKNGNLEEAEKTKVAVGFNKSKLDQLAVELKKVDDEYKQLMDVIPNLPDNSVPLGNSEDDNLTLLEWGTPPVFEFKPLNHWDLGEALGMMDFNHASKLSGSRFVILRKDLARLERALGQYMLNKNIDNGFEETQVPYVVNRDVLYGTGQLPKFEEDLYKAGEQYLIPTAEVPLTNQFAGEILPTIDEPLRYTALTPCFRSEAGSAGRDVRGMLRQHQFNKVELVSITSPERAAEELVFMANCAASILRDLGIPYRMVELCSGDLGFGARKTVDIEAWMPGQEKYREISSVSECGDFQARRMNLRYRNTERKVVFPHTLNGSSLATGRTLIAIMENYQQEDGSIVVPDALVPYMGKSIIN